MSLDPAHLERLEAAFDRLVAAPAEQRETLLETIAADDTDLHDELLALLRAHETDFLARSVPETDPGPGDAAQPLDRAGPYSLVDRLGRGGMGEVWRARRDDGAYAAEVAVKIIRRGLDTDDMLTRFRRERELLAQLQHPNVARIIDAGALEDGRPFLVMELVEGLPIDEHCAHHGLSLDARLELLLRVCDAVQAAHRNLIVHRDLKPSNILVTAEGEPKLLDFGVAKMLDVQANPDATVAAERRYTPGYASPELVRGDPTTTASDVYAIGVILYELITGAKPVARDATSSSATTSTGGTGRGPIPPSRAIERSAGDRARRGLARRVRGDLDRIVAVAMHDDPDRRYVSVDQVADELRAFLAGRPVRAQRDTTWYQIRRFANRHRPLVAGSAIAIVALVAATITSATFGLRATRQARIANAVVDFVRTDLLGRADPHEDPDPNITVRTALDRAAGTVDERFAGEPLVRSAIQSTLGAAYLGLGEPAEALTHLDAAVRARTAVLGSDHPETLAARSAAIGAMIDAALFDRARIDLAELTPIVIRRLGSDHALALDSLKQDALVLDGLGEYDAALVSMERAVRAHESTLGPDDASTLTARNDLALMLAEAGRLDEAESIVRAVLDVRRATLGAAHPDTLLSLGSLGFVLTERGETREAETALREAVRLARQALGAEHARTAAYLMLLADAIRFDDRPIEAEPLAREALAIRRARLGDEHPETLFSLSLVGTLLQELDRTDEALIALEERHRLGVIAQGVDHPSTLIAANNVANVLLDLDRPAEAERRAADTVDRANRVLPEDHWLVGAFATNHGRALMELDRLDEADDVLSRAEARLVAALGSDHARVDRVRTLRREIADRRRDD